jgi:hypothetical protein
MQPRFSISTAKKKKLEHEIRHARQLGYLRWYQRLNALYLLLSLRLYQSEVAKAVGVCERTLQR